MIGNERVSIMTLICEREELAYNRLSKNPNYLELCERQRQTGEAVKAMYLERFNHDEQTFVQSYYEGETEKGNMEADEVYFQGLRDCFKLIVNSELLAG